MFISLSHGGGDAFSGKLWNKRYWNPINKIGLRDVEPQKGKNTVFFVGDSFTAGWGIKNIEDRFGEVSKKELIKQVQLFPEVIQNAAQNHSPALIANYTYDLVREYNSFYQAVPILGSNVQDEKVFRVQLSKKVADTIAAAFQLLGIEVPERM